MGHGHLRQQFKKSSWGHEHIRRIGSCLHEPQPFLKTPRSSELKTSASDLYLRLIKKTGLWERASEAFSYKPLYTVLKDIHKGHFWNVFHQAFAETFGMSHSAINLSRSVCDAFYSVYRSIWIIGHI